MRKIAFHRVACLAVALCACGGARPATGPAGETASDSASTTTLATKQDYPINIAGDAAGVFWTNHLGGQIVALASGGAPKVLADHQDYPLGIAVDKTDVYWTTLNGGTVVKVARSGGQPVSLATRQFGPSGIAVDDGNVYWTNTYAGTVATVSKAGGKAVRSRLSRRRPAASWWPAASRTDYRGTSPGSTTARSCGWPRAARRPRSRPGSPIPRASSPTAPRSTGSITAARRGSRVRS
jgi:sugar lactone lactonase YvrE